jgi:hypothetical protein
MKTQQTVRQNIQRIWEEAHLTVETLTDFMSSIVRIKLSVRNMYKRMRVILA